jgi:hypothetical protein
MAVGLGASTSLVFMIVLLFCLTDLPTVLASPTGPLLQIYYQATRSMAGVSTYQECTCRTGLTDRSGHGPRHFQPHGHGLCHPGLDDGCESYCSCFRQGPRFRSPVKVFARGASDSQSPGLVHQLCVGLDRDFRSYLSVDNCKSVDVSSNADRLQILDPLWRSTRSFPRRSYSCRSATLYPVGLVPRPSSI